MARRRAADSLNPAVCEHSTRGANPRHCPDLELANKAYSLILSKVRPKEPNYCESCCLLDAANVYPAYRKPLDLILARANSKEWWALKDLNLRPTDYESAALTAELRAQVYLLQSLTGI
jgi:hypothetical protein